MINAMDKYFPKSVKYTEPKGGMFLWVTLPKGVSAMRLNYTNADCETIDEGIRRLGDLLKEL